MPKVSGLVIRKNQRSEKVLDIEIIKDDGARMFLEAHREKSKVYRKLSININVEFDYTDYAYEKAKRGNISVINRIRIIE